VYLLPLTRSFKLFLAAGILAAQTFVVVQSSPWDAWAWVSWGKAPYFQLDLPKIDASAAPTTYVTLSTISYSLIAPQFPPSSRWINITSVGGTVRDLSWAQDFLAAAPGPLMLIVPTIKGQVIGDGQPTPEIRKALGVMLGSKRLALAQDARCELLRSRALAVIGRPGQEVSPEEANDSGFWLCPLRYPAEAPASEHPPLKPDAEAAFARIEQTCPRFFPPGARTVMINGGALRHYADSDMKLYVLDDGEVLYKFWRALNPTLVGKLADVLEGRSKIDCDHIRGRAGLPWDREI